MNAVNRLVSLNIIQIAIFPMECGKRRSKLDIVKINSSSVSPRLVAAPVLHYAGLKGSLCLSYIHCHNCKVSGTQLPTSSPVGPGP